MKVKQVSDIQKEYNRLKDLVVAVYQPPTQMEPATVAVFDDTCGSLIQIARKS